LKHLVIALGLTGLAVLATPYGWHYPIYLLTVSPATAAMRAVREYDSIFSPHQIARHFIDYAVIGLALLAALLVPAVRRRRVDWALILVNLVFVVLYAMYVRLTIFWAPIVALTMVSLLGQRPAWFFPPVTKVARALGVALILTGGALGARMVWQSLAAPNTGGWTGFGNSYMNPEQETAYVGEHFRDARICNDYNTGAYLLWKLGPRTKVFIDARAFPYAAWFPEYLTLETAVGIADLLKKYPCDVVLVHLMLSKSIAWFKNSPDWVPAFYGPSAAVFVRKGTPLPGGARQSGQGIGDMRNFHQATAVLAFAVDTRDLAGAERVVAGMERRIAISEAQRQIVANSRALLEGVKAYRVHDYATAIKTLTIATRTFSGIPKTLLARSALHLMDLAWHGNDTTQALELANLAVKYAPNDPTPRYNAGVIKWWLRGDGNEANSPPGAPTWRQDLETFLRLLPNNKGVNPRAIEIAQIILQGRAEGRPVLMVTSD
jgi:hypothetical protein